MAILNMKAKIKMLDGLALGLSKQQAMANVQQAMEEGGIITNIVSTLFQDYTWIDIELMDQEGIHEMVKPDQARDNLKDL